MKRLKYFLMALLCIVSFSFSQTAPDFSVTDVEGNTHNCFYYLNEGKYIVLGFMFDG